MICFSIQHPLATVGRRGYKGRMTPELRPQRSLGLILATITRNRHDCAHCRGEEVEAQTSGSLLTEDCRIGIDIQLSDPKGQRGSLARDGSM